VREARDEDWLALATILVVLSTPLGITILPSVLLRRMK
jgi:hypothetical protein